MFSRRWILLLSAASSLVYLVMPPLVSSPWWVGFKVMSIVLLAALGFRANLLLGIALTVSSIGDLFLGLGERWFLFGLASFLAAHIVYILTFRAYFSIRLLRSPRKTERGAGQFLIRLGVPAAPFALFKRQPLRMLGVMVILGALSGMLTFLFGSLGPMLVPVAAYSLVLAGMGICAMGADLRSPLAAIGALLFIGSDAMIAIGKFHSPVPFEHYAVWGTYYVAQLFIEEAVSGR
jgi:uncharacterized membrane protein YhhN